MVEKLSIHGKGIKTLSHAVYELFSNAFSMKCLLSGSYISLPAPLLVNFPSVTEGHSEDKLLKWQLRVCGETDISSFVRYCLPLGHFVVESCNNWEYTLLLGY